MDGVVGEGVGEGTKFDFCVAKFLDASALPLFLACFKVDINDMFAEESGEASQSFSSSSKPTADFYSLMNESNKH